MSEINFQEYEYYMKNRPHVVILGAGASCAAIPTGDKYGRKISAMSGFIDKLGLNEIISKVSIHTLSDNLEDIYMELDERSKNESACNAVKNELEKVLMKFRVALRAYIEAIRKGNMDIDKINDLMECLGALKEYKDYDKIRIQLTTEELEVLVGRIYDYTVKLAKDNDVELSDEDLLQKNNSDTIINLEMYLKAQKRIFSAVA